MLLTLAADACASLPDARDIGFLLHKNPDTFFVKALPFGEARLFYPEATPTRCVAALLVDVDPVALVRGKGAPQAAYVSDRPYVASSYLSVALSSCLATALSGRCRDRPALALAQVPLTATLHALACDGGETLIQTLFAPLGYALQIQRLPLDDRFGDWGDGVLFTVTLRTTCRLAELLSHLYVLVPVLDDAKHYAFGEDEVEKLLRHGAGWLAAHPERERIARRYLRYRRPLAAEALARLSAVDEVPAESDEAREVRAEAEETLERPARLSDLRLRAALETIRGRTPPARTVIDLGCGEGRTLAFLRKELPTLERLSGMDVSAMALARAARTLRLERLPESAGERLRLLHGSLVYRDRRLAGYDVALLMEVIEHLDPPRLVSLERVVFEQARPGCLFVTTPNAEYNSVWPSLPAGRFRHPDHRFEWTRAQFSDWVAAVAARHGYAVRVFGIGDEDSQGRGAPTQAACFTREEAAS